MTEAETILLTMVCLPGAAFMGVVWYLDWLGYKRRFKYDSCVKNE